MERKRIEVLEQNGDWAVCLKPVGVESEKEMPELEEFSKELAEKDCQIIGICTDIDDDNARQRRLQLGEN